MRSIIFLFAMVLASVSMAAAQTAQKPLPTAEDLSWFTGCWEMRVPEEKMTMTEMWTKPGGGTLLGIGRTVVGGETVSFEYMRMTFGKDGVKYIVRHPSHPEEVAFDLIENANGKAVFQNLENDFPQRIIYEKAGSNGLNARIEGAKDDPKKAMDIPMKRVKCE